MGCFDVGAEAKLLPLCERSFYDLPSFCMLFIVLNMILPLSSLFPVNIIVGSSTLRDRGGFLLGCYRCRQRLMLPVLFFTAAARTRTRLLSICRFAGAAIINNQPFGLWRLCETMSQSQSSICSKAVVICCPGLPSLAVQLRT